MTVRRGDQYRSTAWRGVAFKEQIPLTLRTGTLSSPQAGTGLDLTTWPFLQAAAHAEGIEGNPIAVVLSYTQASPARIQIDISAAELEKAVLPAGSGIEIRPIRITVKAGRADRSERTILDGVIDLLSSGYTL